MTTFIVKPKAPENGKQKTEINIPGSTFKYDKLYVDFEYNRRVGGKLLEISTHHFESLDMLNSGQVVVTSVPTVSVFVTKQESGIIITSSNLKEKIVLPNVEFSTDDTFIKTQLMEVYTMMGFDVEEIVESK